MKKNLLLVLIAFFVPLRFLIAQSNTKSNVLSVNLKSSGEIMQNGQVKGYYNFFDVEKKDKKNKNYRLSITDENLREINSVVIVRPNTYILLEGVFNGTSFGFLFYDYKKKAIELIAYDKTLKEQGKKIKELDNQYAEATYQYIAQGNSANQAFLVSVQDKGFLYYGIKDGPKSGYEIEFYDNKMVRSWVDYGGTEEFPYENAAEVFQSDDYIGSLVLKRTGLFSLDIKFDLLVHDVNTGKKSFQVPMTTPKYNLSLSRVFFNKDKKQLVLFGEYYAKGDNIIKSESLGLTTVVLDMNGKIISEKNSSWLLDIDKLVEEKDKKKFAKTSIMMHDLIMTNDGQFFAVGEQFKSAGIPTVPKIDVFNMVIFQFDAEFNIKKVNVIEKDKNSLQLPRGTLVFSPILLGYIAKSKGGFDYIFSQQSADKSTFLVTYVNYDREKGQKAKNVLGTIMYTPEKVFAIDKMDLTRKSSSYFIYKGKEGYVMVSEYFEKEKRLDNRLEKLNY